MEASPRPDNEFPLSTVDADLRLVRWSSGTTVRPARRPQGITEEREPIPDKGDRNPYVIEYVESRNRLDRNGDCSRRERRPDAVAQGGE